MKLDELTFATMGQLLEELISRSEGPSSSPELISPASRANAFLALAQRLGPRYRTCTFENFEVYERKVSADKDGQKRPSQAAVVKAVTDFCEDLPERLANGGGLLLYGAPGTGKDHLMAAALYWAILKHGFNVQWVDGLTLYQEARDRIKDATAEVEFLARYTTRSILAISDPVPPVGSASPYSLDVLQRIIDHRYRNMRSIWATMNVHEGNEAEARLASPLVDRLRHGSLCLQCEWASYRRLQK